MATSCCSSPPLECPPARTRSRARRSQSRPVGSRTPFTSILFEQLEEALAASGHREHSTCSGCGGRGSIAAKCGVFHRTCITGGECIHKFGKCTSAHMPMHMYKLVGYGQSALECARAPRTQVLHQNHFELGGAKCDTPPREGLLRASAPAGQRAPRVHATAGSRGGCGGWRLWGRDRARRGRGRRTPDPAAAALVMGCAVCGAETPAASIRRLGESLHEQ